MEYRQETRARISCRILVGGGRKELINQSNTSTRCIRTTQKSTKSNSLQQVEESTVNLQCINHIIDTIDSVKAGIKSNISTLTTFLQLYPKTMNKFSSDVK